MLRSTDYILDPLSYLFLKGKVPSVKSTVSIVDPLNESQPLSKGDKGKICLILWSQQAVLIRCIQLQSLGFNVI